MICRRSGNGIQLLGHSWGYTRDPCLHTLQSPRPETFSAAPMKTLDSAPWHPAPWILGAGSCGLGLGPWALSWVMGVFCRQATSHERQPRAHSPSAWQKERVADRGGQSLTSPNRAGQLASRVHRSGKTRWGPAVAVIYNVSTMASCRPPEPPRASQDLGYTGRSSLSSFMWHRVGFASWLDCV